MFSGAKIVVGVLLDVKLLSNGLKLGIVTNGGFVFSVGNSLSCCGVCLTVVRVCCCYVEVIAWQHTISVANLVSFGRFMFLNTECPVCVQDVLHGHLVTAHVSCVIVVLSACFYSDFVILRFSVPVSISSCVRSLSSICIAGVSLTVTRKFGSFQFEVCIIDYTLRVTNLKYLACFNNCFNLEV